MLFDKKLFFLVSIYTTLTLQAKDLFDDSLEDLMNIESELQADVGSRSGAKNLSDTPFAVDVITANDIAATGLHSVTDILRYFVAGFNAPETSIADGSDHVRVFTLRGMSPDQVLVLLNGKRLHSSALLHVNGTIGRGSSNVDLDTIIPLSIERIEILRDGAAAQYGSDAIAGVINIILKNNNANNIIEVDAAERSHKDGRLINSEIFYSKELEYDGFVNFAMQVKDQDDTNRAGPDRRVEPPRVTTHVGIPQSRNYLASLNIEVPQKNGFNIYANALFNYRDSKASAFYRPAGEDNETGYIHDGFLPIINAKIVDFSSTIGLEGGFGYGVEWDLSNTYGINYIKYYVDNSMNYSLGDDSPTSFYNGSLKFIQNTTNFDLKRCFNAWNFAAGLEYRYERYAIGAGDEVSYIDGGSEGFPGYSTMSAVDVDRSSYAVYFDTTYTIIESFLFEGALRYEHYSDFGETKNFKLASSYQVNQNFLLRSSLSTGFRAPSLAQSHYSNIATFGGVVSGTFTPDATVSKALGAESLKAEKSQHLTLGSVYKIADSSTLMVDYFFTKVKDRIMLSNEQTLSLEDQELYGVERVSYFTNAVDTQTYGVDIKFENKFYLEDSNILILNAWYNYSSNDVVDFNTDTITRENSFEQIDRMEHGQPKHNGRLLTKYKVRQFEYSVNVNAHSKYAEVINQQRYWFDWSWSTDVDVTYHLSKNSTISIGSINIFDTLPNKWDGLAYSQENPYYGYDSIKPYSRYSPFGYSGAYYYISGRYQF